MYNSLSEGKALSTAAIIVIIALLALPYLKILHINKNFSNFLTLICALLLYNSCRKLTKLTDEALDRMSSMSKHYDEMVLEHTNFEDLKMQRTLDFTRLTNENEQLKRKCQDYLEKEANYANKYITVEEEYEKKYDPLKRELKLYKELYENNTPYLIAFRNIVIKNKDLLKHEVIVHSSSNYAGSMIHGGEHVDIEFLNLPNLKHYITDYFN